MPHHTGGSFALCCALALIAVGVLGVIGVDLPFLNMLTAIVLILSGLFLVGMVVYARVKGNRPVREHARQG